MNKVARLISGVYWRLILAIGQYFLRLRLRNTRFTIISNDCWGAEVYHNLNLPYLTPFVGLMLMSPCYIKLLNNLKFYLDQPLYFTSISKYSFAVKPNYPIGLLGGDIEIHFLHYGSPDEAREKWERRCKRINWQNIFLKYDNLKDFASEEDLLAFLSMKYPKLVIAHSDLKHKDAISIKNWNSNGMAMFYQSLNYFNLIGWLNGQDSKRTFFSRFTALFIKRRKANK